VLRCEGGGSSRHPIARKAKPREAEQHHGPSRWLGNRSKQYLGDFSRLKESTSSDHELYDAMTELYPDWVSHQAWLMFGFG
jgi:hypothetical protein